MAKNQKAVRIVIPEHYAEYLEELARENDMSVSEVISALIFQQKLWTFVREAGGDLS